MTTTLTGHKLQVSQQAQLSNHS